MRKTVLLSTLLLSFFIVEQVSAAVYYLQVGGSLTSLSSWNSAKNGSGSMPANFTSSDTWVIEDNNALVTLSSSWGLDGSATIHIGDFALPTLVTVIFATGAGLPNTPVIQVNDNATLDLRTNITLNTLNSIPMTGSTIIYGTNSPNILEWGGASFKNLIISENNVLQANIIVEGNLTIDNSKVLSLNGALLTIDGAIICNGNLDGSSNNSRISFSSNSTGGNLKFVSGSGQKLRHLLVTLSAVSSVLRLDSDLLIDLGASPAFSLTAGTLDLNGNKLTINSGANFNSSARLKSSSSLSTLSLTSTNPLNGTLMMDVSANTLGVLALNRSGRSLNLGNAINIVDSLFIQAGTLNTGGFLTVKASASKRGRIARVSGTLSGTATFETYIPGGAYGWAQLGSPGINGISPVQWDTWYGTSGAFGIPITCTGCMYSPRFFTPEFHSIQSWNEPNQTYDTLTSGVSQNLAVGNGYWVFVGDNATFANSMTLRSTGAVHTGARFVSLTNSGVGSNQGYNLVCNPYPSAISWKSVAAANSLISNTYYSFSADNGQGACNPIGGGTAGLTDIIPAGQAFYIDNSVNGIPTINFTEAMKSNNNLTGIYRPGISVNPDCIKLILSGEEDRDETILCCKADATDLFDLKYDGKKMFQTAGYKGYEGSYSKYTTISTRSFDEQDYSINTMGSLFRAITLPVRVRVSSTGSYTINAAGLENINTCYVLYDKVLDKSHDLKTGDYVFNISDTTDAPRFELRLCRDNQLARETGLSSSRLSNTSFSIRQEGSTHVVKAYFESDVLASIRVTDLSGRLVFQEFDLKGKEAEAILPSELNGQVLIVELRTAAEVLRKRVILN